MPSTVNATAPATRAPVRCGDLRVHGAVGDRQRHGGGRGDRAGVAEGSSGDAAADDEPELVEVVGVGRPLLVPQARQSPSGRRGDHRGRRSSDARTGATPSQVRFHGGTGDPSMSDPSCHRADQMHADSWASVAPVGLAGATLSAPARPPDAMADGRSPQVALGRCGRGATDVRRRAQVAAIGPIRGGTVPSGRHDRDRCWPSAGTAPGDQPKGPTRKVRSRPEVASVRCRRPDPTALRDVDEDVATVAGGAVREDGNTRIGSSGAGRRLDG